MLCRLLILLNLVMASWCDHCLKWRYNTYKMDTYVETLHMEKCFQESLKALQAGQSIVDTKLYILAYEAERIKAHASPGGGLHAYAPQAAQIRKAYRTIADYLHTTEQSSATDVVGYSTTAGYPDDNGRVAIDLDKIKINQITRDFVTENEQYHAKHNNP
jgi:hypothetical protein